MALTSTVGVIITYNGPPKLGFSSSEISQSSTKFYKMFYTESGKYISHLN